MDSDELALLALIGTGLSLAVAMAALIGASRGYVPDGFLPSIMVVAAHLESTSPGMVYPDLYETGLPLRE